MGRPLFIPNPPEQYNRQDFDQIFRVLDNYLIRLSNDVSNAGTGTGIGSVTSVSATVPSFLSVAGVPITTSGTIAITYSGTALPVANGGTGTTTPSLVAGTNISISGTWPNQTINSSGGGVTSVAATVPSFLSISGSPITTSGTLAITYSGTALPVANGGTGTTTPSLVAGTAITVTGTWPNQTVASTATQGKQAIYISAGSVQPSIVTGPSRGFVVTASNQPDVYTVDFDKTTQEYAQFSIVMPKKWDLGTVTFIPHWSHTSGGTTFGIVWGLQAVAFSDGDNLAASFGTGQLSIDTGGVNNNFYSGPESSAITVAGTPASQDLVVFRIYRETTNANDTLDLDGRLHGITLFITTNAGTDA